MATPEEFEIVFGFKRPSKDTMANMWKTILRIWPELEEHEKSIHYMYAGVHSEYAFYLRTPQSVADEIRFEYTNGKKNFIFDCLPEGVFVDNIVLIDKSIDLLQDIVNDIAIFYASGTHDAKNGYDAICKELGLKTDRILIMACAGQELHGKQFLAYTKPYEPGHKSKKFLCFNKVERQHRVSLIEKLLRLDLVKDAYYSFDMDATHLNNVVTDPTNKFYAIKSIKDKLPLRLNITTERPNPSDVRADDLIFFEDSYFSVVTETLYFDIFKRVPGETYMHVLYTHAGLFPTEKVYKCLALNHPFIAVSTRGFLGELHRRGYKTFAPFINESYDDILDDFERLDAIVAEIDRLCKLSDEELIEFTHNVQNIVEYNSNHYHNVTDFRITKNVIDMLK